MPIYEYTCSGCQAQFEELIRGPGDERKLVCPRCGARQIVRRPSVFAPRSVASRPVAPPGGCGSCGAAGTCPLAE